MEEDVSVYDIADHPDFHFRTTDIVIRIWNSENGQNDCENEVRRVQLRLAPNSSSFFSVSFSHIALSLTDDGWVFTSSDVSRPGVQGGCEQQGGGGVGG